MICCLLALYIFSLFVRHALYLQLFVPTPLVGGGTIYSNGFLFVQRISSDRYFHGREMWVLSLKSSPSVEFKIKKIFSISYFLRSYRGLKFCVDTAYLAWFCSLLVKFFKLSIFLYNIKSKLHFKPQNESILCVPHRQKAKKGTSPGLTGMFIIKKFEFYLRAFFLEYYFLENFIFLFVF